MAEPHQLEVLRQGVNAWNQWRAANPSVIVDLSHSRLGNAVLRGARLDRALLCHSDLHGADLREADLTSADLESACLTGVNLACANLTGAKLSAARLVEVDLDQANLMGADLTGSNLNSANLRAANLREASLIRATLVGATLRAANLQGADLRWADLSFADVRGALLKGAKFTSFDVRFWRERWAHRMSPRFVLSGLLFIGLAGVIVGGLVLNPEQTKSGLYVVLIALVVLSGPGGVGALWIRHRNRRRQEERDAFRLLLK